MVGVFMKVEVLYYRRRSDVRIFVAEGFGFAWAMFLFHLG